MNSFFNNPASWTQRAANISLACNTELSVLDDADHNANALLEDLLKDIPEIATTYHGIKAESTENSKKNVENNLSEQEQLGSWNVSFPPSATNRVKNEKIFATTATQTDIPKVKDAVIQTMQTNPYPKLSSITFDLNCNQSRGFRELGQLLLDPSLSLPMKYYCLQKISMANQQASTYSRRGISPTIAGQAAQRILNDLNECMAE
uniref:Uncharacterized protein n=1 Tax=Glossina palpalis gambiensis TaxID=67801 RepID=A0A1B0C2H6_9MUSC